MTRCGHLVLFNSYQFLLVFLPLAVAFYSIADRYSRLRIPTLLGLSLVFYGCWDPRFLVLLAASILLNWLAAQGYAATRRTELIAAAIIADLGLLFVFKYVNFVLGNVDVLFNLQIRYLDLALPLGISFFTFHHIMYLVDLRRGRAELCSLPHYALYICFFPQAIAGPLTRWSQVGRQYGRPAFAAGWEQRWARGIIYVVIGLIEKTLLGDALGRVLDPVYADATSGPVSDGSAWFALAFGFQVFFDFSGYSDIAIGLGLIFGIELPENFNAPFRAASILQFWQRWNMTLSRFLRDYVFLPLSDLRVGGWRHTPVHYLAAILLTMVLCGLWHGAGWTFVLWGALHGLAIIFAVVWRRFLPVPHQWIGWAATLAFYLLSAVIFRAASVAAAWHLYRGLATMPHKSSLVTPVAICSVVAVLLPSTRQLVERLTERPWPAVAVAAALGSVLVLLQLSDHEAYEFIYFQF